MQTTSRQLLRIGTACAMDAWPRAASRSSPPRSQPCSRKPLLPNAKASLLTASGRGHEDLRAIRPGTPGRRSSEPMGRQGPGRICLAHAHRHYGCRNRSCLVPRLRRCRPPGQIRAHGDAAGAAINRLPGAITAVEPPFWLGSAALVRQEVIELHLHWPDGAPRAASPQAAPSPRCGVRSETGGTVRKRFRVYEGGVD